MGFELEDFAFMVGSYSPLWRKRLACAIKEIFWFLTLGALLLPSTRF